MLSGAPAALLSAAHYEWIVILIRTYFTINDISDKNFSDEFCVQNSPPACVSMFTTICSTCTSHLRPPRPPIAENGIFGQKLAVLGPFLHRWVHFSDEFCVQSSPPTCVPMCTTICSTCTSHLSPPRPPMAKKSILGLLPEPIFERPPWALNIVRPSRAPTFIV